MNKGKLCVSVCPRTADQMVEKFTSAARYADIVEVRFDCLYPSEIDQAENIVLSGPEKWQEMLLVTFRSGDQGGSRDDISFADRRGFCPGLDIRCWGRDFELDLEEEAWGWLWNRRIFSYHDFSGVPEDLLSIYKQLQQTYGDIMKIAVRVDDITEAIPLWNLIERVRSDNEKIGANLDVFKLRDKIYDQRMEIIPIAMGEAGKWTRILGLAHGAYMTYAALDDGIETAPGQLTARDMLEVYRVKELDIETHVYGVIGDPVSESLSPYIHNAAFVKAKINAVFIPLQVKDLEGFMRRMVRRDTREVELNFHGFAVTMPHKQAVVPYLDAIDAVASAVGAVNTVNIEDGKLFGHNTDVYGFIEPLKRHFGDLHGVRVAVLGAGGAARACVYALSQEGADVTVFSREGQTANSLADEFGADSSTLSKLKDQRSKIKGTTHEIIVNATPLGMKGPLEDQTPLIAEELAGVRFVFDIVTHMDETPLIREAKLAGVSAIGGLEMLLAQAEKQFEIWTGRPAPVDIMRKAVENRYDS